MAAQENFPKIIKDIQGTVTQLCEDFGASRDPITDDSQALHRLCAKLEYLLTSSLKEKSVLGSRRNYWHWIAACLKTNRGLSDGIRYVQGNRELRSSKGRGRAFVRYCLVHQTLADSLQNCLMNKTITIHHIDSNSVLANPTHSSAFLVALYDLNAVNFDLNAKGYDLDSGWPTFASKHPSNSIDKWAIQSHVGSYGSLTSASVVMNSHQNQGSGSSGSHIVDQRVEELVLELDQSDQRMREQQDMIMELESKAEVMLKSSNEKEDILTRVISDLETKNRHLHEAMSNMSTEFQAREQLWSEKHETVFKELNSTNGRNQTLIAKVEQLEQDKRTLEDLVSQHMSHFTSTFDNPSTNAFLTPVTSTPILKNSNLTSADKMEELEALREQLRDTEERCIHLQSQLQESLSNETTILKLNAEVEEQEEKVEALKRELLDKQSQHNMFLYNVKEALGLSEEDSLEEHSILKTISSIREQHVNTEEHQQHMDSVENGDRLSKSLKEENEYLAYDRDTAKLQADKHKTKLAEMETQVFQLKLELDSVRNERSSRIIELEERVSLTNQEKENQERHYKEALVDLKVMQENLTETEKELQNLRQQHHELKQKESLHDEELKNLKLYYEDEICENEFVLEEMQAEMQHHSSLSDSLDEKLEKEKSKCHKLNGELDEAHKLAQAFNHLLDETKNRLERTEDTLSQLQIGMKCLNNTELAREKQFNVVFGQIEGFFEHIRLIEDSDDLDKVRLECKSNDSPVVNSVDDSAKWKISQKSFFDVLQKYKTTKSALTTLEKRHALLLDETSSCKANTNDELKELHNQLSELQNANEANLLTIKDLCSKHKDLQDTNAGYSEEIEKLQYEINDLTQSFEGSRKVADELQRSLLEESSKRFDLEESSKAQESDIESLKEKLTQLLLDKDTLWKENEELRENLEQRHHNGGDGLVATFDEGVKNCSSCGVQFTLTARSFKCRNCEKLFCKNCCSNLKEESDKRILVCDTCFNNAKPKVSSLDALTWETSHYNPFTKKSQNEREDIFGERSDGLIQSPDEHFSIYDTRKQNVKNEDSITIPARREVHLPVYVEQSGTKLLWEISSDRDINFKICYAPTENDKVQELVPSTRINSHVEPFVGDLVARKEGVYTLVLDNSYSMLTAKQVDYKLGIA